MLMMASSVVGRCEEPKSQPGISAPTSSLSEVGAKAAVGSSEEDWIPLVGGSELGPWEPTNFGGEGEVAVKDGALVLNMGSPMTGVTYTGKDFPKDSYEMEWEARRVSGQDFFAGITFPVGEEFCSFIGGGWGGALTGLSSIDGYDASENETTGYQEFKNNTWYKFKLRVDPESIRVSIDDHEIIKTERDGHSFSVRIEVSISQPLGYCTYNATAEVKNWRYRPIEPAKVEPERKTSLSPEPKDGQDSPEFVRIKRNSKREPLSLQTGIVRYTISSGKFSGAVVDLIGAVHVAEKSYYAELNRKFGDYDRLLFELVADPNVRLADAPKDRGVYNPLSAMQVGLKSALKLEFQLDEINYGAKNFVHADMSPEEFVADMKKRNDSFVSMFARVLGASLAAQPADEAFSSDAKLLAALMSDNQSVALRRVLAEQFEDMEVTLSALEDRQGKSTLLTERNAKAFQVLRRELEAGRKRLGIFYGAAHLKDMDRRLVQEWSANRGEVFWLDAWKLDESN
jgi:hypothetical protein